MVSRTLKQTVLIVLLLFGLWQLGNAAYIHTKAALAQVLIMRSWNQALANPNAVLESFKPWRWADTWPVARLRWHNEDDYVDLIVLMGTSGESLAFGPGQMHGTATPGAGPTVLAGHRDTHFSFVKDVKVGDKVELQTRNGEWHQYHAVEAKVVDSRQEHLTPTDNDLWLITCYPFEAVQPGGPLRYVVRLDSIEPEHSVM